MKIGANTKQRIDSVKDEALEVKRHLEVLHARLNEHPGTKRISVKPRPCIERRANDRLATGQD